MRKQILSLPIKEWRGEKWHRKTALLGVLLPLSAGLAPGKALPCWLAAPGYPGFWDGAFPPAVVVPSSTSALFLYSPTWERLELPPSQKNQFGFDEALVLESCGENPDPFPLLLSRNQESKEN